MSSEEVLDDIQISGMSSADITSIFPDQAELIRNIEFLLHQEGADNLLQPQSPASVAPVAVAAPAPAPVASTMAMSLENMLPPPGPAMNPNQTLNNAGEPWVDIIEQPKARGLRFRYECEGRSAGSIPGENSTTENRTYPTIQIHNAGHTDAIVVVSCVSKENSPLCKPHPHSLVGKDCSKGVCTVRLKKTNTATFTNLGIQCAKKKDIKNALDERKKIRVDPYHSGFKFDPRNIDLSVVRLCFQVFLPDKAGKFTRIVPPVTSQCIYDKKAVNDLVICRISKQAGSARGGEEVFLLCEKVSKEDVEVRFYEEGDGGVMWEARGEFGVGDVHRQFAIVFKTPPYRDPNIQRQVKVYLQLKRPGDGETSEPIEWQYYPADPDPEGIVGKRKRKKFTAYSNFMNLDQPGGAMGGIDLDASSDPVQVKEEPGVRNSDLIKERLKLKAQKGASKPKHEVPMQTGQQIPVTSFNMPQDGTPGYFPDMMPGLGAPMAPPTSIMGMTATTSAAGQPGTSDAVAMGLGTLHQGDANGGNGTNAQSLLSGLSEGGVIDEQVLMQYFGINSDTDMQSESLTQLLNADLSQIMTSQASATGGEGESLSSGPDIKGLHEQLNQLNK